MDMPSLIHSLEEKKWKNITTNASFMGYTFDIIGERNFTLTQWHILIKFVDSLNKNTVEEFKNVFVDMKEKSKSWIWGSCILFCVIAKTVDPTIIEDLKADTFGLFGIFRLKGGGGNILLVNLQNREIYGKIPKAPYDVSKFSKDFKKIMEQLM